MLKINFLFLFLAVFSGIFAFSVSAQTEMQSFNVDSSYDLQSRKNIEAVLVRSTGYVYFYIEKPWWESRSVQQQNDIRIALFDLGEEFQNKIYPVLTSTFGSEPRPGVDKDERITVLIHQMVQDRGGYFNSGDVYPKVLYPASNEREMVYLNSQYIGKSAVKGFLAHEFLHLITTNQKDLLRNVTEEIWLNELRAEAAPVLLGYEDVYKGSNLEKRVRDFLAKPSDSLVKWLNQKEDYGIINLFLQYLLDHYGKNILVDSLHSSKTGISSINEALAKNGFKESFSQVFTDWAIAVLANNCKLGEKYCYLNQNLKDFRIVPALYYLPKTETYLSTFHNAANWAANWHRFVGGGSEFALEFDGDNLAEFEVPYLLCDFNNNCQVSYLILDGEQKGKISFSGFSEKYSSLTIIPFVRSETEGFDGKENSFPFSWQVSVKKNSEAKNETELINRLLAQIEELKKQISEIQAKINAILGGRNSSSTCAEIKNDLYLGLTNNQEVRCLQDFFKKQGRDIYPEGLVTGNFLSLTLRAVIRFQEKYASEILAPLGLSKGTGTVGPATRQKINELLVK